MRPLSVVAMATMPGTSLASTAACNAASMRAKRGAPCAWADCARAGAAPPTEAAAVNAVALISTSRRLGSWVIVASLDQFSAPYRRMTQSFIANAASLGRLQEPYHRAGAHGARIAFNRRPFGSAAPAFDARYRGL